MARKPNVKKHLTKAINQVGLIELGRQLDINYQLMYGWRGRNKMPASDFSGTTVYAARIEHATGGLVTTEQLLGFVPPAQQKEFDRLNKKRK